MPVARDGQESHGGHTMDKKENQPREKKGMPLAPVFLLGATVLLLIEMYFIVNLPRVYLVQIILGAAILACTYVFIAALLKEIHKTGEQAKDEYERMLRGEKASYLMLKKISEQLEAVDRNTREPGEEIITAQKAIAKVTITRSKENADALMNSNDRVVDNLLQLKESMDAGFEQFAGKQQNMMDDSVKELVLKQQEFAEELKDQIIALFNGVCLIQDGVQRMGDIGTGVGVHGGAVRLVDEDAKIPVRPFLFKNDIPHWQKTTVSSPTSAAKPNVSSKDGHGQHGSLQKFLLAKVPGNYADCRG